MRKISAWLMNARFAATMQSLVPAILAAVFAIGLPGFKVVLAVLAVIGVNMAHCAANLLDDYFDYKVEMLEARMKVVRRGFKAFTAKYPYLTDGSATLKDLRIAIAVFGGIAVACGAVIFIFRGWPVLVIATLAAVLSWFYSGGPLKLSFHGLGELTVGIVFGPLLMLGVYFSAGGQIDSFIWIMSVPVGLQVMNILFTHSIIDNEGDDESEKLTLCGLLKSNRANLAVSAVLNFVPFVVIAAAVASGLVHWAYIFSLLMLPRAVWLFRSLVKFVRGEQIDEDHPKWYLGRFDYWELAGEKGLRWYLIRWFTARNIVTGTSFVLLAVKVVLLIF